MADKVDVNFYINLLVKCEDLKFLTYCIPPTQQYAQRCAIVAYVTMYPVRRVCTRAYTVAHRVVTLPYYTILLLVVVALATTLEIYMQSTSLPTSQQLALFSTGKTYHCSFALTTLEQQLVTTTLAREQRQLLYINTLVEQNREIDSAEIKIKLAPLRWQKGGVLYISHILLDITA